jgi:hypothetical protein
MSPTICNHGFWLTDCPLCLKRPGECDYGSCTASATASVATRDSVGRVVERRPMCAKHAKDSA